jgi:hypothetical protein
MATVYSLICFGGRTGKTVTMTIANPCAVTSAAHGLQDGTGVVFSTTGALPTGVTSGTTYYTRSTAADTFNLYDTSAHAISGGTTGRVISTGSQSGTHTIKSAVRNGFTTAQLLRYGTAGSERIYDGLSSMLSSRGGVSAQYDTEIVEIADAFTDSCGAQTLAMVRAETIIAPEIEGVKSAAWHDGTISTGYQLKLTASFGIGIDITGYRHTIRDINIISSANSCQLFRFMGMYNTIDNCFLIGTYGQAQTGLNASGAANNFRNNVVLYMWKGVVPLTSTTVGNVIANNIVAKGETGFFGGTNAGGFYYNNLSVGNTTANWTAQTGINDAVNNFGISTDTGANTPWYKGTDTSKKTLTANNTTFVDYAGNNLRPASVTAPQVDNGVVVVGMSPADIAGDLKPSYNNGGAEAWDGGAFEFDNGFGLPPTTVDVTVTGLIDGSRLKIKTVSGGTSLYNGIVSGTSVTFSQVVGGDTLVDIYARKGTATPYYEPEYTRATISATAGLDLALSQSPDIAASTYVAGVATDWSVNTGTLVVSHVSGSTIYTVQDVHSRFADYYDDSGTIDLAVPIDGTTPTIFSLVNGATISDADHQYLKGGSISEADGATLWSNVYSVGGLSGSPTIYIYQGSTLVTNYWAAGHVDLLLKVKASGSPISSGLVTGFSRKWGYTYDHYEVDLSAGGRNVMPLSTSSDVNNQTSRATVAAYSGITVTFGTYSRDFGDGAGAKTYYAEIDCNNLTLLQVYEYTKYLTDESNVSTLNGVPGNRYLSAHSSMSAVKSAPFGTFAGGTWSCAPGVWLKNVPTGDTYNYIVTDSAAGTHQNVQALFQSATVSNIVVGSRVQIYDTTNSTELYNDIAATSIVTWNDGSAPAGDRAIRVRIQYVNGTTAKNFLEANIGTCGTSAETKDVAYLANQTNDTTYIANAKDGSTVTGITIVEGATDRVQISIAGGSVPWADIYAYQCYWLFTATGIQDDGAFITAPDTANYVLTGFKIKNTHATVPLIITSGYGVDSTGSVSALYDTTGTSIFPAPAHVVPFQTSGSYAITGDISTVMSGLGTISTQVDKTLTKSQFIALKD